MNSKDRKTIKRNLSLLVNETPSFQVIVDALIKRNLFSPIMIETIKSRANERLRLEDLYNTVCKRGPDAFYDLISALNEIGCKGLARVLKEDRFVVTVGQQFMDSDLSKMYSMRSRQRGHVLLINNIYFRHQDKTRNGAQQDSKRMVEMWKGMGYELVEHRNLGIQKFEERITEFAKMEEHALADSAIVVIMTHGDYFDSNMQHIFLETSDNNVVYSEWILSQFTDERCPNLRSKPKIFIFVCCRGKFSPPIRHDGHMALGVTKYLDMLIVYSALPEFVSLRNINEGSIFAETLCTVFCNHAHNSHVTDMLHQVTKELGSIQVPCFECRSFDKKLYFNPGLYQTDSDGLNI